MPSRAVEDSPSLPDTVTVTGFRAPAHLLSLLAEEISSCTRSQDHYRLVMIPSSVAASPLPSAPLAPLRTSFHLLAEEKPS
jgi:hypothetical protein